MAGQFTEFPILSSSSCTDFHSSIASHASSTPYASKSDSASQRHSNTSAAKYRRISDNMASPKAVGTDKMAAIPPPFLSLPLEIRTMIYHQIFKNRTLILADCLTPTYMCGRRYRQFCLHDPSFADDSSIPLLQACKQISNEAQPIFAQYVPSHLLLDKDIHSLPSNSNLTDLKFKIGVPVDHITSLSLNADSLGENKMFSAICDKKRSTAVPDAPCMSQRMFSFDSGFEHAKEGAPPDPMRLPNLINIYKCRPLFTVVFPALRELHIYDVLKNSFRNPGDFCTCPKAGTKTCACGECYGECSACIDHPLLPDAGTGIKSKLENQLHRALVSRYRAALPYVGVDADLVSLDYLALRDPLEGGVDVYLHDKVELQGRSSHQDGCVNGVWYATYHLAPSTDIAKAPAIPPTQIPESPRELQRQGMWPLPIPTDEFNLDFSTLENVDVLENFDFDSFLNTANHDVIHFDEIDEAEADFENGESEELPAGNPDEGGPDTNDAEDLEAPGSNSEDIAEAEESEEEANDGELGVTAGLIVEPPKRRPKALMEYEKSLRLICVDPALIEGPST